MASRPGRTWALLILQSFVVGGILYLQYGSQEQPGGEVLPLLNDIYLPLAIWHAASWYLVRGSVFDLYGVFLGMSTICHAGLLFSGPQHRSSEMTELLVCGMFCVLLGLASLHLGALARAAFEEDPIEDPDEGEVERFQDPSSITGAWVVFGIALVPSLLSFILASTIAFSSGFESADRLDSDIEHRFFIRASYVCCAASLMLLSLDPKQRYHRWFAGGFLALFCVVWLLIGKKARGGLALLSLLWLWDRRVQSFPRRVMGVAGVAFLFLVLPALHQQRGRTDRDPTRVEYWLDLAFPRKETLRRSFEAWGIQILPVSYALALSPEVRPPNRGLGFVRSIESALLYMSPDHDLTRANQDEFWVTYLVNPEWLMFDQRSVGFSFLAELYLAFGWIGLPILAVFLGAGLASIVIWERKARAGSEAFLVAVLILYLPLWARMGLFSFLHLILWLGIVPFLFLRWRQGRSTR